MLKHVDIQKEIYEGREKARRDERARTEGLLERGLAQGMEKGTLIGRIETLQSLLGQEAAPRAELTAMSVEDLQKMADELRQQFER